MKKISLIIFIFCCSGMLPGKATTAADIIVNLNNVENDEGQVMVSICPEAGFMKDFKKCWKSETASASQGVMRLVFNDVPAGDFAVMAYHDMNANNRLDTGLFGIPSEGWGVSNNARGRFGAPSFKDAAFTVGSDDIELSIRLRY
jgi:uncharacterized protein (DUF2141 family)